MWEVVCIVVCLKLNDYDIRSDSQYRVNAVIIRRVLQHRYIYIVCVLSMGAIFSSCMISLLLF